MLRSLSWTDPAALAGLAARLQRDVPAPATGGAPARVRFPLGGASEPAAPTSPPAPARFDSVPAPPPFIAPPSSPPSSPPFPTAAPGAAAGSPVAPAPAAPAAGLAAPAPKPVTGIKPSLRPASGAVTGTSSASWQRPSFLSVEIDAAAIGLDPEALRRAMPPAGASAGASAKPGAAASKPPAPARLAQSPAAAPSSSPPARADAPMASAPTPAVPPPTPLASASAPRSSAGAPRSSAKAASRSRSNLLPDSQAGELVPLSGGLRMSPSASLSTTLKGTFAEKLDVFVHWLMGSTGAYAAFVVDDEGLEVANRHATDDLLGVSALIDRKLIEARRLLLGAREGSFALELDAQNVLHVIWAEVDDIRYGIGLVLSDALDGRLIQSVRKTFRTVAAVPEAQPRSA